MRSSKLKFQAIKVILEGLTNIKKNKSKFQNIYRQKDKSPSTQTIIFVKIQAKFQKTCTHVWIAIKTV